MDWIILLAFAILIGIVLGMFGRRDVVPWLDGMQRVKPENAPRAEWVAPQSVIDTVIEHYQAYLAFAQETLSHGWIPYARDLHQYLTGDYLELQRTQLETRLRKDDLRLIEILRANHEIRVRDFSDDGMTCLLLDYQTERRLATYHYWSKRRVHTQGLDDVIVVYKMRFDNQDNRWKISEPIQELPPVYYIDALNGPLDKLDTALPDVVGRDQ